MELPKSNVAGYDRTASLDEKSGNAGRPKVETGMSLLDNDPLPTYTASSCTFTGSGLLLPVTMVSLQGIVQYSAPNSSLSPDRSTQTIRMDPENSDCDSLTRLIQLQGSLPPRPIVRIQGTHVDFVYSWGTTRVDFDLTLDVTPSIAQSFVGGSRSMYLDIGRKPPGMRHNAHDNQSQLRDCAQGFADDCSKDKRLVLVLNHLLLS